MNFLEWNKIPSHNNYCDLQDFQEKWQKCSTTNTLTGWRYSKHGVMGCNQTIV
jgi:hypothetical protein